MFLSRRRAGGAERQQAAKRYPPILSNLIRRISLTLYPPYEFFLVPTLCVR